LSHQQTRSRVLLRRTLDGLIQLGDLGVQLAEQLQ
jgi:hypothetical protein